jgi:beta-carotene 15,15'-dioxygenase
MEPLRSPRDMIGTRKATASGTASVGWHLLSADRSFLWLLWQVVATLTALIALCVRANLETHILSAAACGAILLFGLPHGALDLQLVGRSGLDQRFPQVAMLYLACASAMYLAWRLDPTLALAIFLVLSIFHFAEDWADHLPSLFSRGIATALLFAPALHYPGSLASLFQLLGGKNTILLVDMGQLVAPVACAIAAVGVVWLWTDGRKGLATATATALIGMLVLPPLIGFALFFGLMHSPSQFVASERIIGWPRARLWAQVVAPMTLAALAISAAIFDHQPLLIVSDRMIGATFVTLSVLTLPHMLVPFLVRHIWPSHAGPAERALINF